MPHASIALRYLAGEARLLRRLALDVRPHVAPRRRARSFPACATPSRPLSLIRAGTPVRRGGLELLRRREDQAARGGIQSRGQRVGLELPRRREDRAARGGVQAVGNASAWSSSSARTPGRERRHSGGGQRVGLELFVGEKTGVGGDGLTGRIDPAGRLHPDASCIND
jgi:hypothetical protein